MVFKCQEDSFLKEFTSKVVSCSKCDFTAAVDGKKSKINGFEVVCEDTILFPEGGGQPSDHGYLNDKKVHQVIRKGSTAVHFTEGSFDIGENVTQAINWTRRLDHMQQHSGQHLLSAILERDFHFKTVSWWLGEEVSYIELDTPCMSEEQIKNAEECVNDLIRQGLSVTVRVFKEGTLQDDLDNIRPRDLPKDHIGDVRIIVIDGIDSNMCCGTHVSNLCQLQAIKLLHAEKSARKNKILLYFLVGNRVISRLNSAVRNEQKLTALLNNGPAKHVELVDKLLKNSKILNKNLQTVLKDLVVFEVEKLKNIAPLPKYYVLHRKEADPDFMSQFIREFDNKEVLLFLSVGDEKGTGNIVLYGTENIISDLGNKVCELLSGKGAGKANRFQAKVSNMANRSKVEELFKEYFK